MELVELIRSNKRRGAEARNSLRWHCGLWTYGRRQSWQSDTFQASGRHQGEPKNTDVQMQRNAWL